MVLERLNVPAPSWTTWPLGQDAMAELICAAVAPGFNVAQMVVRFGGMSPVTPAVLQSVARAGSMMPVQDEEAAKATPQRDIHSEAAANLRSIILYSTFAPRNQAASGVNWIA